MAERNDQAVGVPYATESKYPEHDKLRGIKEQSQAVGDFLEWCDANGFYICEKREPAVALTAFVDIPSPHARRSERLGDAFLCFLNMASNYSCLYWPTFTGHRELLAKAFDIDQDKLENEKRAMLDECRNLYRNDALQKANSKGDSHE